MTHSGPATAEQVRRAPKVVLHDHLDGGLRPATVVELAAEVGHELPAAGPTALADWFAASADSGSLERYLETFAHTVGVMQTPAALVRVARECVEDLADDGVVYAEVRYAPELHVEHGLTPRRGGGGRAGGPRPGHGRARTAADRGAAAADRDAAPGPLARDRRAGDRLARPGRGRLRHRRRRGRLPAHPAPGRLRVPAAGERALHDPRRRGVRAALDLAGPAVVRGRPARSRRADRRRHHLRRARRGRARPAGRLRARPADPARAVPAQSTCRPVRCPPSPSTRSAC